MDMSGRGDTHACRNCRKYPQCWCRDLSVLSLNATWVRAILSRPIRHMRDFKHLQGSVKWHQSCFPATQRWRFPCRWTSLIGVQYAAHCWLFVDLPSGIYDITAMYGAQERSAKGIKIVAGRQTTLYLRWPEDAGATVNLSNE